MSAADGQAGVQAPSATHDIVVVGAADDVVDRAADRITAAALRDGNIRSLADLPRRVPGLTGSRDGVQGVAQYSIRGIRSPAGSATVTISLDGVPVQVRPSDFTGTSDLQLLDIDHVTVAKGPQGTGGGPGALAGEIRFTSRRPDAAHGDAGALAEGSATRFGGGSYLLSAQGGGPVAGDRLAMRGAVIARRAAGYVDRLDPVTGRLLRRDIGSVRSAAGRWSAAVSPGGGWTIIPALHAQRSRNDDLPLTQSDRGRLAQAFVTRQPGRDSLTIASLTAVRHGAATVLTLSGSRLIRDQRQASDYSPVFGELVLGGAYPGLLMPGGSSSLIATRQRNRTHEVRLASAAADDRPWSWAVGAFQSRAVMDVDQTVSEPGLDAFADRLLGVGAAGLFGIPLLPGGVSYAARERDRETRAAVYATVAWRPAPRLVVEAGLRAERVRVAIGVSSAGPYAGHADFVIEGGARVDRVATPRMAAQWRVGPHDTLRAAAARGYRPGGANTPVPVTFCAGDLSRLGLSAAPGGYRRDTLWSHEIGYRRDAGPVTVDAGVFLATWHGIAQQIDLPGCGFAFVANAGRARSTGFETTIVATPVAGLRLTGAIGYADARFRDTARLAGATGSVATPVFHRGNRIPYVPRWTAALSAEATQPTRSGEARVRADYAFTSGYTRAAYRGAAGYDPVTDRGAPTHRVDLLCEHRWRRWSAAVFVENLTDARPALLRSIDVSPVTRSPVREVTFRPRTIGLRTELAL